MKKNENTSEENRYKSKAKTIFAVGIGMIGLIVASLTIWFWGVEGLTFPVEKMVEVEDTDDLVNVGDWAEENYYSYQLDVTVQKRSGEINQVIEYNDVTARINKVQLVRYEGITKPQNKFSIIPEEYIEDDSFYAIRIEYELENLEYTAILFDGIEQVVTNVGDDINVEENNYRNTPIFSSSAVNNCVVVVPINYDTASKVSKVTVHWGGIIDLRKGKIKDSKKVTTVDFLKNNQ